MPIHLCTIYGCYSGIYDNRASFSARIDGKVSQFLNAKCKSGVPPKRSPRQTDWTILYRRENKKGQSEEIQKKRTLHAVTFLRAVTGASLADIMAKQSQKPEVRKQKRLSKHLKRLQWLLLRHPQRQRLSKRV
uniref:Large ribosomal subunit protein eL24 n=1 Tax=Prolemur simus TaxID=1328070 RepID=A0A8C9DS85_PROSS